MEAGPALRSGPVNSNFEAATGPEGLMPAEFPFACSHPLTFVFFVDFAALRL